MNIIFFLINVALEILWGLTKIALYLFVCGAITYSLWWLLFQSAAAGPYLIGSVVIAIILWVVSASSK
jgi:hypothetical protein